MHTQAGVQWAPLPARSPTDPPTPTNRGTQTPRPAHPRPAPAGEGRGRGSRTRARAGWAGPPGALTPLQPQRLHQRSHVGAAAASRPPARSPVGRAGLRETTPPATGAPCGGAVPPALLSLRRGRPPHLLPPRLTVLLQPLSASPYICLSCPPHLCVPSLALLPMKWTNLCETSGPKMMDRMVSGPHKPTAFTELRLR